MKKVHAMKDWRKNDLCYIEVKDLATLVNLAKIFRHKSESVNWFLVVAYDKI